MADKAAKPNIKKTASKATKPSNAKVSTPTPKVLVKASARNLRLAPRKMRLLTNLVKGMRVADALVQLQFTNKKGAKMLSKLLMSAAANAENNFSLNRGNLFVKEMTCDMGEVMQRSFPRARGSAFVIRRKLCHVNVTLEERAAKTKKSKVAMPKVEKKDKPVITKEGSVGIPDESVTKLPKEKKVKETHNENTRAEVEAKTSPENLTK